MMKSLTFLGIYREEIFSPGKVRDDAVILEATLEELASMGHSVRAVRGESVHDSMPRPRHVLTMAQSQTVLDVLENWSSQGTRVTNSVSSIRNCYRKPLTSILAEAGLPMPPTRMVSLGAAGREISPSVSGPLWLKRGDVHAVQDGDVASVSSEEEVSESLRHFRVHKIEELLVQDHVEGSVVKFYGVGQGEYFSAFLASTGEDITHKTKTLAGLARRAAKAVGLEVYGGDAILTTSNDVVLIDLNDWPSFSRCCRPAARSIADYLEAKIHGTSSESR